MLVPGLEIIEFESVHTARFREINEQWITRSFELEEEDNITLADPQAYVIDKGGKIYMALLNGYPVATCGYLYLGEGVYEMIKMAVDEKFRGKKIGLEIGEFSIKKIFDLGAKKIILLSNTKGSAPAISLYRKLGFHEVPLGESEFKRADIRMEMDA